MVINLLNETKWWVLREKYIIVNSGITIILSEKSLFILFPAVLFHLATKNMEI
jgi:hypothetical protein